ncbi:hypothetical protein [Sorangium sp. So ce854]|uniref:hypothetical protein n=1 Tax=Sorangium sp. So ce854 TaxID=3133322 RepID=UPI003F61D039
MANVLPAERRLEVLAALVNGTSIRAASRMTGVHQDTIGRFGQLIGEGCARLHDRLVRDLTSPLVDLDEQHSWCRKRQVKVDAAKGDGADVGEQWTWAAICRTSKLIIAWHVGKRDQESADALVEDVRARLVVMPQITTDGLGLYAQPIAANFGPAVPYMQTVKNFSARPGKPGVSEKYAVPRGVDFIQKRAVFGTPDPAKATNYAIERSNLTARQWNARLRRRTLAFSKKLSRHCAAVALHYVYTNLCHIPRNMRVTPAMQAGITRPRVDAGGAHGRRAGGACGREAGAAAARHPEAPGARQGAPRRAWMAAGGPWRVGPVRTRCAAAAAHGVRRGSA